LQPVMATAKSLSSKAVGTPSSGINGMNAALAASA
jgi:hypothetical protein